MDVLSFLVVKVLLLVVSLKVGDLQNVNKFLATEVHRSFVYAECK